MAQDKHIFKANKLRARYVAYMGEVRNAYKILVQKPEGMRDH
jgi:hypothetical protein